MVETHQWVYRFEEGDASMRALLGGKGANLAEMTNLGLPVPPGFTLTAEACRFYRGEKEFPKNMWEQVAVNVAGLEEKTGRKFGDVENPLLVSVRSGARFSMPGMMDTVLNVGLNDKTVHGIAEKTGDQRFAYDAYRRLIQMFGKTVMGVDDERFEEELNAVKYERNVVLDTDLDSQAFKEVVARFKKVVKRETGAPFPKDPMDQLKRATSAVFDSWMGKRAIDYRRKYNIPDDLGTAVNVQAMVFGNMGEDSATGVVFSRNPDTGEPAFFGEFLTNAQGEDVVAGIRTPRPIDSLRQTMPDVFEDLVCHSGTLEQHYQDMQDIEFTVEHGKLYILQTRNAKRSAAATVRTASDMVHEGLIKKEDALARVTEEHIEWLLLPQFDPSAKEEAIRQKRNIAKGTGGSPGAAYGKVVFDADKAAELGKKEKVILVRKQTAAPDVHGIFVSAGVLTAEGGKTSHAAVVARGAGIPAVVGSRIDIDDENHLIRIGDRKIPEGAYISIDGATGEVFEGEITTNKPDITVNTHLMDVLAMADTFRRLGVRANADTSEDALKAKEFGAEGIGLCRTEHMFFDRERVDVAREMIMTAGQKDSQFFSALSNLLDMQRADFKGILSAMDGKPVTIRLLDAPLHEFVPDVPSMEEENPMLGLRGCRFGILYPEVYKMQMQGIFEASCQLKKDGFDPKPEIMIPLVGNVAEIRNLKGMLQDEAKRVMKEEGVTVDYTLGTMIELPAAALDAAAIAKEADFFSFGTNDLTQTTLGISRDDSGRFLPDYMEKGILQEDPFQTIDPRVQRLVEIATREGREGNPSLKVGICGEHGGDPKSIKFFDGIGLDYVSMSPYRVPVARLAAARSQLVEDSSTK